MSLHGFPVRSTGAEEAFVVLVVTVTIEPELVIAAVATVIELVEPETVELAANYTTVADIAFVSCYFAVNSTSLLGKNQLECQPQHQPTGLPVPARGDCRGGDECGMNAR